jgi:hypothetical protein
MKIKLHLTLIAIVVSGIYCNAQPNYVSSAGLKAYWPFNSPNLANSLAPSVYVGTYYPTNNPPTLVNDRFGSASEAYKFDGTNWIETPCAGVLGDSARAVSFWAKTQGGAAQGMYVVGWGDNGFGDRFGCSLDYPAGMVGVGGANCSQIYNNTVSTSDNKWHHYVFQFSTAFGPALRDVKVWMDAVQIATTSVAAYNETQVLFTTNGFNVTFGKIIYPVAPEHYTGDLDETGIWKRVLTQCEISDLYHADLTLGSLTFNPAGYLGSVSNLIQYAKISTGNSQFSTNLVNSSFSGTGVSFSGGQYHFNSPATLPAGLYTITHTYTLQGGCVRTATQTIKLNGTGISTNNGDEKWNVELFPNPATDEIHIQSTLENSPLQIIITDVSGKTVFSENDLDNNSNLINISSLSNGIYFAEISAQDHKTIYKKIVVSK